MTDVNETNGLASPSTAGPLQGEALTQHKTLLADPEFQNAMSGRGGHSAKEAAMRQLENISKGAVPAGQGFGKPGVTSEDFRNDPAAADALSGKLGVEEQAHARNQLSEIERMEAIAGEPLSDREAAELAKAFAPSSPLDYANAEGLGMNMGEDGAKARQILFDHDIPPQAARELAPVAEKFAEMSDETYFAAIDSAKDVVMRWPGGREMISDAAEYLNSLTDEHPLARIAENVAADPRGIKWLAFMHRKTRAA